MQLYRSLNIAVESYGLLSELARTEQEFPSCDCCGERHLKFIKRIDGVGTVLGWVLQLFDDGLTEKVKEEDPSMSDCREKSQSPRQEFLPYWMDHSPRNTRASCPFMEGML